MAPHRSFTEDEIATALATLRANNGNAKKTAQALGISRTTLRQWAGRAKSTTAKPKQVDGELVEAHTDRLAKSFQTFAEKAMDAAPERIPDMSGKDLLIAAGIATEKVQLLRGGPTSRTNTQILVSLVAGDGRSFPTLRDASLAVLDGEVRELPAGD